MLWARKCSNHDPLSVPPSPSLNKHAHRYPPKMLELGRQMEAELYTSAGMSVSASGGNTALPKSAGAAGRGGSRGTSGQAGRGSGAIGLGVAGDRVGARHGGTGAGARGLLSETEDSRLLKIRGGKVCVCVCMCVFGRTLAARISRDGARVVG